MRICVSKFENIYKNYYKYEIKDNWQIPIKIFYL